MDDKTIAKAFEIVKKANDPEFDFMSKYSDYLTGTGERSVDYSEYTIPLDEYYYLSISFIDYSLSSFSVLEFEN